MSDLCQQCRPKLESLTVGLEIEVLFPPLPGLPAPLEGAYEVAEPHACQRVAAELRQHTGDDYRAPRNSRTGKHGFFVVPETDLDDLQFPEEYIVGVEIITSPRKLSECRAVLSRLRSALLSLGAAVSQDAGAHINISHKDGINGARLALCLDEEIILNTEGRYGRSGLQMQECSFFPKAIRRMSIDPQFDLKPNWISNRLGRTKRFATNLGKLDRGYVELRHWSAETILFDPMDLDDLIQPYYDAIYKADCATHQMRRVNEVAAATHWLDIMESRIRVCKSRDNRCSRVSTRMALPSLVYNVEIDGAKQAEFSEDQFDGHLKMEVFSNPSARLRHGVDLADVRETLAHMVLQEARHCWRTNGAPKAPKFVEVMLDCMTQCGALPADS